MSLHHVNMKMKNLEHRHNDKRPNNKAETANIKRRVFSIFKRRKKLGKK